MKRPKTPLNPKGEETLGMTDLVLALSLQVREKLVFDLVGVNNRAALARVARIVLGAEPSAKMLDALEQAGARAFFEARP